MLATHGHVLATELREKHAVAPPRMLDAKSDNHEMVQLLKSLHVPRVDWNDETLDDVLEFLKLKMEALQTQGIRVPALTYKIGSSGSKTITLHADNISYWGVLEHLRRQKDLKVMIEAARIHVESR
ncbi:hypothetical protein G5S37_22970 [Roseimicrobium sp. ORNL1]|nr:hypothetical protein G5S37_22970 [Roseimicrobium sp. ORNL1]